MKRKLTKSRNNVVVSGVLGGIGEYLGIDATIIRVIYVLITFFGVGSPVILYLILSMIMPSGSRSNYNPYGADQRQYDRYQGQQYYGSASKNERKRKEAEKVSDDDWSDF